MRRGRMNIGCGVVILSAGIVLIIVMSCISAAVNGFIQSIPEDAENVTAEIISYEVIDHIVDDDFHSEYVYMLSCEYTIDGRTYTADYKTGQISQEVKEGDTVTFVISPDDPEKIYTMGMGDGALEDPVEFMKTVVTILKGVIYVIG